MLTTILIALAVGGILAAGIRLAYLAIQRVRAWYLAHRMNGVAILLKQKLENNEYRIVQGFFNTETNQFGAAQAYEAGALDPEIEAMVPEDEDLAILQ